jgi:hypothetical protein
MAAAACCAWAFRAARARTDSSTSIGTTGSKTFEDRKLAFPYQAKKPSGEDSTFFKLVRR